MSKCAISVLIMSIIGLILISGYWASSFLRHPFVYEVHAQYSFMPENDDALREWLNERPGVLHCVVARYGKELWVNIVIDQNIRGCDPPVPDLTSALATFGYHGQVYFHWEERGLYFRD